MRFLSTIFSLLVVVLLSACGGGGGSPGLSSTNTPTALFSTAPAALTLPTGSSVSYPVSGGVAPYAVVTDTVGSINAALADTVLSISAVSSGTTSVFITDAKGTKLTVTVTVPTVPLASTAPSSLTLVAGSAVSYPVTGGVAPYTVVTDSLGLVGANINQSILNISAISAGTVSVIVSDSKGVKLTVAVTVPQPTALFTTAQSSITLAAGLTSTYSVSGGTPPYRVTSNNTDVTMATVSGSNGQFLDIKAVAAGGATVQIADAKGAVVSISVTVPAPATLFTTAPSALTLVPGASSEYLITGGTAPYVVNSSNASVVSAAVSGSKLTIGAVAGGAASVIITDAKGTTISVAVTVSTIPLTSTSPSSITIPANSVANVYSISGGTPPYIAKSSNEAVATANVPLGTTGLVITGLSGGAATVVVTDSKGAVLNISVSVPLPNALYSTAPASITMAIGSGGTYTIAGGTAPYAVSSSDAGAVRASVGGNILSIAAVSGGASTVLVTDSKGLTISLSVTVGSSAALFVNSPATLALGVGASASYQITGGTAPYTVTAGDGRIANAFVNGATLTVSAAKNGSTTLYVFDSAGGSKTVAVNVGDSTSAAVTVNAPSPLAMAGATTASYQISGGTAPYSVSSSDARIASATIGATTLTINAIKSGLVTLYIYDANGASKTINVNVGDSSSATVTVNAPSPLSMGASTTAVYQVSGGTAPYSVSSSDARIASATISGSALTINATKSGAVTLYIFDANGGSKTITVNVDGGLAAGNNYPVVTTSLQTIAGASTSSIDPTTYTVLKVTLKDPGGFAVPNQVISVVGDLTKLSFPDGNAALTDVSGVASIKVARASLLATGAGSMTVTYDYKSGMIANYRDGSSPPAAPSTLNAFVGYQVTTANITLTGLNAVTSPLAAYGTSQINVTANINGSPAPSTTPVTVNFTANCGQVIPASALSGASGAVLVTYSAVDAVGTVPSTLGCSGKSVTITASSVGTSSTPSITLPINAAPATSMSFVSAAPTRIYLANSGGVTQSTLTFQLVNQLGEGIPNRSVQLTLKSLTTGIQKAAFDTLANSDSVCPVTLTSDANGKVTQPVYSGAVPTNVIVNAALVKTRGSLTGSCNDAAFVKNVLDTIQIDSSVLTIASGRPVQTRLSLALEKRAIRGFEFDGATSTVTLNLSDRQGNPVPDGTVVNFVTEAGVMIPPTCVTGTVAGNSTCTVTIRSQGTRPANGLVTIMAYAPGEEDFVDTAGDNAYHCGNTQFTDQGLAYRDDTMTSSLVNTFVAGSGQFTVPRAKDVAATCVDDVTLKSVPNPGISTAISPTVSAGDGIWGATDVRKQTVIVFSTDRIESDSTKTSPVWTAAADARYTGSPIVTTALTFFLQDRNGNSVPSGSPIKAVALDNTLNAPIEVGSVAASSCGIAGQSTDKVPDQIGALAFRVDLRTCVKGDQVQVTVTTPVGDQVLAFTVPN